MTIYLYVKTHNKTGLKYLGKTISKDPHKYPGSGTDWKLHLKKYGYDYNTYIIRKCQSKLEASEWGRYYSNLWNIVYAVDDFGNKIYANRIPETGGGCTNIGFTHSEQTILKMQASHALRLIRQNKPPTIRSTKVPKGSADYREKMRKLASGKSHFYNPVTNEHIMAVTCPFGFIKGVGNQVHIKGKHWFHHPITQKNVRDYDCPTGYVKGKSKKH